MKINLSPPWVTFYREVEALFKEDPEVKVVYNENTYELKLLVDNPQKADALAYLLPEEKEFGNIKLTIKVIPANKNLETIDYIKHAFAGNPVVSFYEEAPDIFANKMDYVVFRKEVVQFYNDDMGDVYGNVSTLYEDLARDVLGDKGGVFYCTDNK